MHLYKKALLCQVALAAPTALLLNACGGAADSSELGQSTDPIINGTVVTQETEGVVKVNSPLGLCSGTLLTNSWILTAKHCVHGQAANTVTIAHEQPIGTFTTITASTVIENANADAALVSVPRPFNVFGGTNTVNTVLNLLSPSSLVNQTVTCYGYGSNATAGAPPTCSQGTGAGILRKANLSVSSSDNNIVTVVKNASGQTPFHGDSGGPCFYNTNGYRYQVGVASNLGAGSTDCNPINANYVSTTGLRDWVYYNISLADESLGGGFSSGGAIANYGVNTLDLFGRGNDNALWEKQWTGSSWTPWQSIGGTVTADPAAAGVSSSSMFSFIRGSAHDILYKQSSSKTWSTSSNTWTSLGGNVTSDPAAVNSQDGKVWLFGRGGDNALWYRTYSGSSWSNWASLGGTVTSDPTAASMASGVVHVFYLTTGNKLEYKWFSPSTGWSGPNSIDNTALASAPAATSSGGSQLDLFVKNSDGSISYRKWYGVWAPSWSNIGYTATSNIAATSWAVGRMDVIFRGTGNDMRHFYMGG